MAIPEEGNFEQSVNAHFLSQTGYGIGHDAALLTDEHLRQFLEQVPEIRERIDPSQVIGNSAALEAIRRYLPVPTNTMSDTVVRVA